jgi:hypothetical protein
MGLNEEFDPIADYFAVIGVNSEALQLLDPTVHNAKYLRDARSAAITDVAVVRTGRGETCPEGYQLVGESVGGRRADLNHGSVRGGVFLAVRRGGLDSRHPEYVAGIAVVFGRHGTNAAKKSLLGPDWELVETSVGGHKAKLNKGGDDAWLAIRRARLDARDSPPPLRELCVVIQSKGETFPQGYRLLSGDLNRGKYGDVVRLGYRVGESVGLCGLAFTPSILDRYPPVDAAVFPFPQDQLSMFAYPRGVTLKRRSSHDTPKPTFYSFLFTNEDGRRTYASCLTFYEPLAVVSVQALQRELCLEDEIVTDGDCFFIPKTICIISRFPIYGVLRRFLRHLYAISLSSTEVPLEKYIAGFVSCIPMPLPGGRGFHVYLEPLEGGDATKSRLKPLSLSLPPFTWLPLMDIDFSAPFRCLSVSSVLSVFCLMLQEAKLLFVSSRAELLTQVMESLRSLLFPLEWQSVYVPRLPQVLSGCLECPGGFMIGMHLTEAELADGTAAIVTELGLAGTATLINLDNGELLLASGELIRSVEESGTEGAPAGSGLMSIMRRNSLEGLRFARQATYPPLKFREASSQWQRRRSSADRHSFGDGHPSHQFDGEESLTHILPETLRVDLQARLEREVVGKGRVRLQEKLDLDQYESAFEFAPAPDAADANSQGGLLQWRLPFSSTRIHSADIISVRKEMQKEIKARGGSDSALPPQLAWGAGLAGTSFKSVNHPPSSPQRATPNPERAPAPASRPESIGRDRGGENMPDDNGLLIRDAFVASMAELLGGIGRFVMRSELKRVRGGSHPLGAKPLDQLFNMEDFLGGLDPSLRPFVRRITTTQMFWVLVQQWLESGEKDEQLVFFEDCVTALQNRKAGAVVPTRDDSEKPHPLNIDDLIPLVDEVRLEHPDTYGFYSSAYYRTGGGLRTPALTPSLRRWHNSIPSLSSSRLSSGTGAFSTGDEPLDLLDASASFLIIPGPVTPWAAHGGERTRMNVRRPAPPRRVYTYETWPTPLTPDLLRISKDMLPNVVPRLQAAALQHRADFGTHRRSVGRGAPLGTSLMYGEFEAMIVIPLEAFEAHGSIPRSDEALALAVPYSSLKGQRKDSLVLFISHQWLAPDGLIPCPDPDGAHHKMICQGARHLLSSFGTPKEGFLWIDFSCLDQDDLKRRGRCIRSLPSYIERCDAVLIPYLGSSDMAPMSPREQSVTPPSRSPTASRLSPRPASPSVKEGPQRRSDVGVLGMTAAALTPRLSPQHGEKMVVDPTSSHPRTVAGGHLGAGSSPRDKVRGRSPGGAGNRTENEGEHLSQYQGAKRRMEGSDILPNPLSVAWENGWPEKYPSLAEYAKRAWCRAELFVGSHVPIPPDGVYYFDVMGMSHSRAGDRPLFVYGPEQEARDQPPAVLPRLDVSWFRSVNPVEGALSHEADRREIFALVERVQCTTPAPPKPGFQGQKRLWWPHGSGRKVFDDGRIYEGFWRHGRMHGHGVMQYARGSRFEGTWHFGKKCGAGHMIYPDGARYEGEWHLGWRHGKGKYTYASGATYSGDWKEGKMDGLGTYTSASGSVYQGQYQRGKRHGLGRMVHSDGRVYDGEWRNGLRDGHGFSSAPNGTTYEGPFRKDRKHGRGLATSKGVGQQALVQHVQEWVNGRLILEEPADVTCQQSQNKKEESADGQDCR